MNLDFFTANLYNPAVLIPNMYKELRSYYELKAYLEYNPAKHKVNDTGVRRDKRVQIPDPDDNSAAPRTITEIVKVNRLAIPMQQSITLNKTAFTTGGKVRYKALPNGTAEENTFKTVLATLRREKTDPYKNSEICKSMLSQTEVAEIWYSEKDANNNVRLKCNIYTPYGGNQLIPVFDGNNDMIAFGRAFKTKSDNDLDVSHLHVYTIDKLIKYSKSKDTNGWVIDDEIPLLYGKIPVIYYSIPQSCWEIVQPLIERVEFLLSNHADTNDYNGSPILLALGTIKGWSRKGEAGKVIEAENGADLKYIESANTPESIKMEWENLMELISTMTQSPNLSMEKMAKLTNASGEALERMLMNAHLGAMDLQNGVYGIGIQRRLNFLVSACSNIFTDCKDGGTLEITPEFGLFRLDNTKQLAEVAKLLKESGLASDESLIGYVGLSDDPASELEKIKGQVSASNL